MATPVERSGNPSHHGVSIYPMAGRGVGGVALAVSVVAHAALLLAAGVAMAQMDVSHAPVSAANEGAERPSGGDTFDIEELIDDEPGHGDDSPDDEPSDEDDAEPGDDDLRPQPEPPPPPPPPPPAPEPAPEKKGPVPLPKGPKTPLGDEEPMAPPDNADPLDPLLPPVDPDFPPPAPSAAGSGEPIAGEPKPPGGEDDGEGKRRRYGGAGLPRGVEHLAKAFTWLMPSAVSGHKAWRDLPLGDVGSIEVTLRVDKDGKVVDVTYDPEAPELMRAVVDRTMALVRSGRFALAAEMGVGGSETLHIDVAMSQLAPHPDLGKDGREPHHVFDFGRDPPELDAPGRAFFTMLSGRHFEAKISIVKSQADD